jgi:IS30 family transposase
MLSPYKDFVHYITSDNGKEFMQHKKLSEKLLTEFSLYTFMLLGKED